MKEWKLIVGVVFLGWLSACGPPSSQAPPPAPPPKPTSISEIQPNKKVWIIGEVTSPSPLGALSIREHPPVNAVVGRRAWLETVSQVSKRTESYHSGKIRRGSETVSVGTSIGEEIRWASQVDLKTPDGQIELDTKFLTIARRVGRNQSTDGLKDWPYLMSLAKTLPSTTQIALTIAQVGVGDTISLKGWVRQWESPVLQVEGQLNAPN